MAARITLKGVSRRYGPVAALDDVSLDVAPGEFMTLLGPSGSGKTTLLMMIAGFVRPDAGSLRFDGREMRDVPAHRRGLGMVFQGYAVFPHLTVAGNVAYPLRMAGVARAERDRRVDQALALVRLDGLGHRRTDQISGGQRQRVALARALVAGPPILLMDEPLSALDRQLRDEMQHEIRRLHAATGATTVYVTHDQREAMALSDRIAVMGRGRIHQVGRPEDIYDRPSSRWVAGFIGDAAFLPLERDGALLRYDGAAVGPASDAPRSSLRVRPEDLQVGHGGDALDLHARVDDQVFQGDSRLVFAITRPGHRVAVRLPADRAAPARGDVIALGLPRHRVLVLPDA